MRKKQTAMQTNPLHPCSCAQGECTCPSFEKETALDAQVDGIYRVLKGRIDVGNLIPTCIEVAKEIENAEKVSGKEKLELLQKVLRQAVKESDKSVEEKEHIIHMIETVVPLVMKAAVLASKSPIVGQIETAVVSCCIPRMKKIVSTVPPQ